MHSLRSILSGFEVDPQHAGSHRVSLRGCSSLAGAPAFERKTLHHHARIRGAFHLIGWTFVFSIIFPTTARPSSALTRDFLVNKFNSGRGLPHNQVRCLAQTPDGYLWVGTWAGLARFDGNHFTVFNRANTPEMVSDNCVALAVDSKGALWIGTDNGLLRRKDHRFTPFRPTPDGLSHANIRYLSPSPRGGVWIATQDGLNYFQDGKFTRFTTASGLQANNIRAVCEDTLGNVWVGTEIEEYHGGFQRLDRAIGRFIDVPGQGTTLEFMTHTIMGSPNGHLWWGNNRGLHEIRDEAVQDYSLAEGLSGEVVKWISPARDGGLWVVCGKRSETAGKRGLQKFKDGRFVRIDLTEAEIEDDILCVLEDREGSLWVGTRQDGLIQLQPRRIVSFTKADGLINDFARSICESLDGSIWVGTDYLNYIKGGIVHSVDSWSAHDPHPDRPVSAVLVDHAGHIWMGKESGNLYLVKDGNDARFPGIGVPQNETIFAVYEDRDQSVWVGYQGGVFLIKSSNFVRFDKDQYFLNHHCGSILQDMTGRVWLGTFKGGVFRYENGKFDHLTIADGLSSDNILSLHEDSLGAFWVGTDNGLNRYRDGQFRSVSTRQGLFDSRVNSILEDDIGQFWIGCNHGIYKVSRDELNAAADGRINQVHCVLFGESDGMPSSQTSSERQPVACKARDGKLWFGTTKGVAVIDPKTAEDVSLPPPVAIEQVIADGEIIYGARSSRRQEALKSPASSQEVRASSPRLLRLGPGRGRVLEVHYTANSFVAPDRMRFRFRLAGHDKEWQTEDANLRLARYTDLSPGQYRFQVKACNSHNEWSPKPVEFAFSVAPHFYETWSFYGACAFAVIGAAAGIQYSRLRGLRRILALQQQASLEHERARIAQDMHDELGANLTNIALLGEVVKRNLTRTDLVQTEAEKISTIAGGLVDNLSELVWATNPKYDTLPGLVSYLREKVGSFFEDDSIRCQLDFPVNVPDVPMPGNIRRNLYLAVKEALHNALKHSGATEASVRLSCVSQAPGGGPTSSGKRLAVEIQISDNGGGFNVNGNNNGLHHGLENMRRRLADLNGIFDIKSEPGRGTHIYMRINLA